MLDLSRTAPLEGRSVAIFAETCRIPEANRSLHAQLALEGTEWRGGVERPVAPRGAGQAVLKEHPDDRHHCKTAVRNLSCKFLLLFRRVTGGQHLPAEVAG